MLPIRTLLCPTDLSKFSANAFSMACSLARDYGARVLVLHVNTPPAPDYLVGLPPLPEEDPAVLIEKVRRFHPADAGARVEYVVA